MTKLLPKGGIYEVSFGYHSKSGGYTTLMSDILKLNEIHTTLLIRKFYKNLRKNDDFMNQLS